MKAGTRKPRPDKRRARGRIEHTLLDGEFSVRPNRPKTFARTPTIPQEVTDVSICDKGSEPLRVRAPTHERSRCAAHGEVASVLTEVCTPHRG